MSNNMNNQSGKANNRNNTRPVKPTRGGIEPSKDKEIYPITTDMARNYLQNKFSLICQGCRERGVHIDDINIILYSQKIGKTFIPFLLILPEEVLERGKNDENIPWCFRTDTEDAGVRLFQPFFELLKPYTYSKEDRNAFFHSRDWKQARQIEGRKRNALLKYATPKIEILGDAGRKVVVLIDPIRLFHDMLSKETDRRAFEIWIKHWNEIDSSKYEFFVERVVNKKQFNNRDEIYAEMLKKINNA